MADLEPFIQALKDRLPLEQVVGQKVQLTRRGRDHVGLCPFHAEKTPSFHVRGDRGFYKCFGCGASGDVITFVRETEGREFLEALRVLADLAGMEMPQQFARTDGPGRALRDQAREALAIARRWAMEQLAGADPGAAQAREYLQGRGITGETAKAFGLGWMPNHNRGLAELATRQDIPLEALEAAGLVVRRDGGQVQVRFRERLLFPVADAGGRTVGFGGRYLPGSWAEQNKRGKYENSPEGPLFPKRQILYGIERLHAGLRDLPEDPILVCEGYLDVILLHQAGLTTSVAALGTALTEEHARKLVRYDRTVVLLMDPDEAGRRAAAKAGRLLVAEGVDVRVAELPDGADPADMVTQGRLEELRERVEKAWDILHWRLDTWSRKADLSVPTVLARAASEMAEWISTTPSPVVAEVWTRRAQEALGVSTDAIRRLVPGADPAPVTVGRAPVPSPDPSIPDPASILRSNEREIVAAILHDPSALSRFRSELESLKLSDSAAREVLSWSLAERAAGKPHDLESCMLAFPEGPVAGWLDAVRLARPSAPGRALELSLQSLPGNREQAARTTGAGEPTEDELRAYARRISISPQDAN